MSVFREGMSQWRGNSIEWVNRKGVSVHWALKLQSYQTKGDTSPLSVRLSSGVSMKEGVCERWPATKPQSAFDRAALGCGAPPSSSSYETSIIIQLCSSF